MASVTKLDLSNNQIKSISADIASMQKLNHLSLANNKIKDLPKGFSKLKSLKYLNLNNNPLKSELAEVIGSTQNNSQCQAAAANIISYFKGDKENSKKQGKL